MIAAVAWVQLVRLGRSGQPEALRWRWFLLVAAELGMLLWAWAEMPSGERGDAERLVMGWLDFLTRQQMAGVLLVGPALSAGAITDEKASRTLEHLLIAPLEGRDIAWGKWLAFCAHVGLALSPGVPAVALLAGLLGLPPGEALGRALYPFLAVPAVVALAVFASALARHTPAALLGTYAAVGAALAGAWAAGGLDWFDPTRERGWPGWAGAAAGWLAPAAALVPLAGVVLRPVYFGQLEALPVPVGRALPPVGDDPVGWREAWLVGRGVPLLGAMPTWLGVALVAAGTLAVGLSGNATALGPVALGVAVVGALAAALRAAGAVSGERVRRTWDDLLLLPVSTRGLLHAKLMGAVRALLPYQFAFFLAAVPVAWLGGWWCLLRVALTWGMSWPLLYFAAALGLSCSVRAGGSWQSLALSGLYWGWALLGQAFALACVAGTVACGVAGIVFQVGPLPGAWAGIAAGGALLALLLLGYFLLLALALYVNALEALREACAWVEEHERIKEPEMAASEEPE